MATAPAALLCCLLGGLNDSTASNEGAHILVSPAPLKKAQGTCQENNRGKGVSKMAAIIRMYTCFLHGTPALASSNVYLLSPRHIPSQSWSFHPEGFINAVMGRPQDEMWRYDGYGITPIFSASARNIAGRLAAPASFKAGKGGGRPSLTTALDTAHPSGL